MIPIANAIIIAAVPVALTRPSLGQISIESLLLFLAMLKIHFIL